jgi:hypothetical protein
VTSTPQQAQPLPVINGWRPLAADDQAAAARAEAEQVLADARAQANQITRNAREEADTAAARTIDAAKKNADEIRDAARQDTEKKTARSKAIDVWSLRGALAATIGLTASGEFALAQLAGWSQGLAWLLPAAVDVYVVQAFRRHRDVPAALALMVLANAIFHLADRGLFGVVKEHGQVALSASGEPRPEWWLIVAVAAIAPVVMWRIHRLSAPARKRESTKGESSSPAAKTTRTPARTTAAGESTPTGPRESSTRTTPARPTPARESKPKAPKSKRDSSTKGGPAGDIAQEIEDLVALMRERGGADAVKLPDAERIVASTSQATAARRLKTARETYRKTA